MNNDWIDRHFAFFKGLDEIKDTECALALKFGSDCYIVCEVPILMINYTDYYRRRGSTSVLTTAGAFLALTWLKTPSEAVLSTSGELTVPVMAA